MSRWNEFKKFTNATKYLPDWGDGDNKGTQAATAVSRLVYKWYNDGDVYDNNYGMNGWLNNVSGCANWLYKNIPSTQSILDRIYKIGGDESEYEDILCDLAALVDPLIPELAKEPRSGDAYDEKGPFKFTEAKDDDDDDDDYLYC